MNANIESFPATVGQVDNIGKTKKLKARSIDLKILFFPIALSKASWIGGQNVG